MHACGVRPICLMGAHEPERRRVIGQRGERIEQLQDALVGNQFATHRTAARRPRRRSRGGPAATGTSHPGGTTRMRSAGTPDLQRSSTRLSAAATTPLA